MKDVLDSKILTTVDLSAALHRIATMEAAKQGVVIGRIYGTDREKSSRINLSFLF